MNKEKLLQIFYTEASELIPELENDLVQLEKNPRDPETINNIFRLAHTIKGGAGAVGLESLASFTHTVESVLDRMRSSEIVVTQALITVILSAIDILKKMLDNLMDGGDASNIERADEVTENLKNFLGIKKQEVATTKEAKKEAGKATDKESIYKIKMKFRSDIYSTGTDPLMLLKELAELGEVVDSATYIDNVPSLDKINIFEFYPSFDWALRTKRLITDIQNVFIFVMDDNDIRIEDITQSLEQNGTDSIANKKIGEILVDEGVIDEKDIDEALSKQKKIGDILVEEKKVDREVIEDALNKQIALKKLKKDSTVRVATEKLDKLVNAVGEMVINVARVAQLSVAESSSINRELTGAVDLLDMICRDIQELVMRVRMFPIANTFNKFQRVVRDLAAAQNKAINLIISGSETELDKNVIEQLEDPLKHLIRNSVDHGIETSEDRAKMNKNSEGTVWLRAYQQEGNIFVEIEDDGKGINADAVLAKAIKMGIASAERHYSKEEIYQFMFAPGLSTAEKITELSGRGVGLDVVKRNMDELRGTISVESEVGKGSKFIIKLPLTLAIIEGMNVQVGSEVLTIPLLSVVELIRPDASKVKTVEGSGEVIEIRGVYLPLVRLYKVFQFKTEFTDPTKALVVILESGNKKFGILVDEVIGEQQAVIKSLDKNFKRIKGVSGATILGDGKVSLIVDIHGLEELAFKNV